MKELTINTGLQEYRLNDVCTVFFNPTDTAFVEKLFGAFDALDQKQEEYRAEVMRTANKKEIFETARKMDAEMREMVNSVFETDVCSALFGAMNVYSLADGLPVWANLFLAVMDEINDTFTVEQKKANPRISKYTKKYIK